MANFFKNLLGKTTPPASASAAAAGEAAAGTATGGFFSRLLTGRHGAPRTTPAASAPAEEWPPVATPVESDLGWLGEAESPAAPVPPPPTSALDAFLRFGARYSDFTSSNILWLQYDAGRQELTVRYKARRGKRKTWPERSYAYSSVSEREAEAIARGEATSPYNPSRGGSVWDHLRVRGSRTRHRKPFRRID